MATITQVERSADPTGLVTETITTQDFAELEPSGAARSYKITQADGVWTRVEESFTTNPAVYAIDVSTTQEPIESHPFFASMTAHDREAWALWKQNPNNPELNGWNPATSEDQNFQQLYDFWQKGITNYFAPRIVIKETNVEDSAPDVSGVGHVSDTGYTGATGSVNFILAGVSGQQEGTKYRVTREFLGSAINTVWNEDLYGG
jgi:hypothetical protein